MDTRSIRNRLAATILAFAVATTGLTPLQASAQVGAGRPFSVEVPEVARLEGRRMARPAWVVGDVPDTVWVLVERAAAAGGDEAAMRSALGEAELRAREALVGNEKNVGRRFALAVVLGVRADREGGRTKVRAASALYEELDTLLTLDAEHASARHMMGRLHAGVRRMNGVTRWLATNLLGGATLKQASWEAAEEHLAFAERSAPSVPDHHLQLARLFLDTGRPERAAVELDHVLAMEPHSPLEIEVRREAEGLRAGLEAR